MSDTSVSVVSSNGNWTTRARGIPVDAMLPSRLDRSIALKQE
jgi:hypothetical protein